MILHINDEKQFLETIKEGKVFVDFFATWCGPCNMLGPVIEEMDANGDFGDMKVVKVDVDEAPEIAIPYQVQAIPTLLLMKEGKLVNRGMGYMNKNQLENFISK